MDQHELLRRSLDAIDRLNARVAELESHTREPIAIVGMSCRLPGDVVTPAQYWDLLREGRSGIREIPRDRWNPDDFGTPESPAPRYGGFLAQVDQFDAAFFGIAPREAAALDPQQRLLLECAWEALEDAGQPPRGLVDSATGVYVGITQSDYGRLMGRGSEDSSVYSASGTALNAAAGRISFFFGFQGPCVAVDTACSSSLVATHLACQGLRSGECDMALVGGVNAILDPELFALFSRWGMISPTGECRTFDEAANGFVRGEGCGVVVLKRLKDAIAARDRVLAIIRGSAVNQDGASSGLSVPNGPAQVKVIRAALASAGLTPGDVGFVEAHGTGTLLGDPIEVEALAEVYSEGHSTKDPLWVGSVKPSIGHLESAAGIAGLMKLVLTLRHGHLPPQRSFERLNSRIDWSSFPIRVVDRSIRWPAHRPRRIGAVSSFGFSGTNAHLVLEAYADREDPTPAVARPTLLPLSARSSEALRAMARRLRDALGTEPHPELLDVERTLMQGRSPMPFRAAVVGARIPELLRGLNAIAEGEPGSTEADEVGEARSRPRIVFLMSGQGSQYHGMGQELERTFPEFARAFHRCNDVLRASTGLDLDAVLRGSDPHAVDRTGVTQPALFALEYALTELLGAWGVRPDAVLGHSVGEYVAACAAGVMEMEDAMRLVAERGRLMQELPPGGGMLAVAAPADVALEAARPHRETVSLAGLNGPEDVVLSGRLSALRSIATELQTQGVKCTELTVSHAFHSPLVDPIGPAFQAVLASVRLREPRIPLASNLTGAIDPRAGGTAEYWSRHVREPVRFESSVRALVAEGFRVFLEVGPRPVLSGMARRFIDLDDAVWIPTLRARGGEASDVLTALGRLYGVGATPAWEALLGGSGRIVSLPTYPFQRKRHWAVAPPRPDRHRAGDGSAESVSAQDRDGTAHPILGRMFRSPVAQLQLEVAADPATAPILAQHRLAGDVVFPAAGILEVVRAATERIWRAERVRIRSVELEAALVLGEVDDPDGPGARDVRLLLTPSALGEAGFELFSRSRGAAAEDAWTRHAVGRVDILTTPPELPTLDRDEIERRCTRAEDIEAYRARMISVGLEYGPSFLGLVEARGTTGEAVGTVRLPMPDEAAPYGLHPGLLDAAFHLIGVAYSPDDPETFLVPRRIEEVVVASPAGGEIVAHCIIRDGSASRLRADIEIFTPAGEPVAVIRGLETTSLTREQFATLMRASDRSPKLLALAWEPMPLAPDELPIAASPTSWIVVADDRSRAQRVASALVKAGGKAAVCSGADVSSLSDRLASAAPVEVHGIVDLRGAVDDPIPADDGHARLPSSQVADGPAGKVLSMLSAAARGPARPDLRVILVTRLAQRVRGEDEVDPRAAAVWALGVAGAAELSGAGVTLIDVDDLEAQSAAVASLALGSGPYDRLALRGGEGFSARLTDARAAGGAAWSPPYHLAVGRRGDLDSVHLESARRAQPGPGQVEIEVLASGLNFRDVLNALDLYPGDPGALGNECSGRVVAVGDGVDDLAEGSLVTCIAEDTFASHVVADRRMVFPVPAELSIAQAAVFPIAQLTAYLALHRLGELRKGDRVLIHAGAGGVGLAALHIARAAGAVVLATAGSEEKRAFLREAGAAHVWDSRTLLPADEVKRVTEGRGVDLVLNSLTGDMIDEGLRSLASGGRFLEIGLRDVRSPEQAAAINPDALYIPILLGDWCKTRPDAVAEMWGDLADLLRNHRIPAPRVRRFPIAEARDAFRYMARARHVGRIALTHPRNGAASVRADCSYLVTGGLGALGLRVAEWLAEQGAKNVVLVGRRPPAGEVAGRVEALRASGVTVDVVTDDITRIDHNGRISRGDSGILRGVIHAAGVTDDAALGRHDAERLRRVTIPKADGAAAVLKATEDVDLDFLVFFSSGSALLGSPGQAAYVAANGYLDGLASRLAAQGRAATSIGWGAWSGGGMAAGVDERTLREWAARGVGRYTPRQGVEALAVAMGSGLGYVAALPIDWAKFCSGLDPLPPLLERLQHLRQAARSGERLEDAAAAERVAELAATLRALPARERAFTLAERLAVEVAAVLGMASPAELEPKRGFTEQGMDSLMAVELAGRLGRLTGVSLPSTFMFDHPTLDALVRHLMDQIAPVAPPDRNAHAGKDATGVLEPLDDLEGLSEESLEAELRLELDRMGF